MLIAHITDLHIKAVGRLAYRVVDTASYFSACVDSLRQLRPKPNLLLMTGDLADAGRPEEYERLKVLMQPLDFPVVLLPGNHDDRAAMRSAWPDAQWAAQPGSLHHVVEGWPVRIVCLDTVVPGQGGGRLDAEGNAWLDQTLALAPMQPTIVAMHHPPFVTGITHMDAIRLDGAEHFAAIVARHPQVERVLCGHLHRPVQAMVGGRLAISAPSPAHQVALDLADEYPPSFVFEPPGYMVHLWTPAQELVSHTVVIGDYGKRYPFFEKGSLID
jgi:3',5'-cyclic AMP phosphodiesterase CpdA